MKATKEFKKLVLRGRAVSFIDWANVYGWEKSLKSEISPRVVYNYLKTYSEIGDIRLYFGTDIHPKSNEFLEEAKKIGYTVVTKPVKHIAIEVGGAKAFLRKCDFDMEICIDVHELLKDAESFIFFTGDGDFEPLYKLLIERKKQVIVVYTQGHLGKEIWQMKKGIFKVELKNLIP